MAPNYSPSIQRLGLENWLNMQRGLHNGYGYDDYMALMGQPYGQDRVSEKFGVAVRTVFYWEKQEKLRLVAEDKR